MGCFDEVIIRCPVCRHTVTEQTKAGACSMSVYCLEEAPPDIVVDFDDYSTECQQCGHLIRVKVLQPQVIVL